MLSSSSRLAIFIATFTLIPFIFPKAAETIEPYSTIPLKNSAGEKRGEAILQPTPHGVLITLTAEGLTPGKHAVHFHQVANCDPDGGFKHAEAHIDPMLKPHGFLNKFGPHEADLPNLIVGKDGIGEAEFYTDLIRMKPGKDKKTALLDKDGSSIMVHEKPDDYLSQPSGNSGPRILCGEIK